MQKMKDSIAKTPFDKAALAMKVIMIFNAIVLIITAIIHFVFFKFLKSFNGFVLTIYLIIWAVLFVLIEFSLLRTRTWFFFMNFGWGKALFLLFIGLLLVAAGKSVTWVDILSGVWFILCAVIFFIISMVHKDTEAEFVKDLLDGVEKKQQEKEAAAANRV
jgi:hypothetical protein